MSEAASSSCRKYSPDLNPIEQVFAKFKTLCCREGGSPKLPGDLRRLRQNPRPITPPAECAAYLKNAGYA